MKGTNQMHLNEATMVEAVQVWINKIFADGLYHTAPKVTGVKIKSRRQSDIFIIDLEERKDK